MVWIVRLCLTALVATIMAVIGYQLMFKQGVERWNLDEESLYFVVPSVLLWLALAVVLYRGNYVTAMGWGLLSPIVGSFFVGGPAGPVVALVSWYVTFPIGILTGVLVKLCLSIRSRPPRTLQPSEAASPDSGI